MSICLRNVVHIGPLSSCRAKPGEIVNAELGGDDLDLALIRREIVSTLVDNVVNHACGRGGVVLVKLNHS